MFCLKSKESSFLSDKMGGMLKEAFRSGIVYRASRDNVFNSEKHLAEQLRGEVRIHDYNVAHT